LTFADTVVAAVVNGAARIVAVDEVVVAVVVDGDGSAVAAAVVGYGLWELVVYAVDANDYYYSGGAQDEPYGAVVVAYDVESVAGSDYAVT